MEAVREALRSRYGLIFAAEDDPWLAHRLAVALGLPRPDDEGVARQIRGAGGAADRVAAAVVPTTSQFAGGDPLMRLLPTFATAVARPAGEPLVLWSLGCGTGAEAYSALFALADGGIAPADVRIYGADLVEAALERARLGAYEPRELATGLPVAWAETYLEPVDGTWRVRAPWREAARWVRANLCEPLPAMPMPHMVLCRHVLGWLTEPARRQALASVAERLRDRGVLLVDPAEADLVGGPFEALGEAWPGAFRRAARGG